jgi:hypothetical protein
MPLPSPSAPDKPPSVIALDLLHPRIAGMIEKILLNQQVLTQYDAGQLTLHYKGGHVKAELGKLPLPSHAEGHRPGRP